MEAPAINKIRDIWVSSDWHLSHANILKFRDKNGNPIRSFSSAEEMDETLIERHNARVKDGDYFYNLGDVSFHNPSLPKLMARFKGKKRLILGNHDRVKEQQLYLYFQKITTERVFRDFNLHFTHIPVHPDSIKMNCHLVHGHIHEKKINDPRYINVCVEHTDYRPLHIEEIVAMTK